MSESHQYAIFQLTNAVSRAESSLQENERQINEYWASILFLRHKYNLLAEEKSSLETMLKSEIEKAHLHARELVSKITKLEEENSSMQGKLFSLMPLQFSFEHEDIKPNIENSKAVIHVNGLKCESK